MLSLRLWLIAGYGFCFGHGHELGAELHEFHSFGGFILESMDSDESGNRVVPVVFQLILEWEDGLHFQLVLVVDEVVDVLLSLDT